MATEIGPNGPPKGGLGAGNPAAGEVSQREAVKAAQRYLHDHWKYYTFQGALMIVVGILALLVPFAATLATTLLVRMSRAMKLSASRDLPWRRSGAIT